MAEGFVGHLAGDGFEPHSAGVSPTDEVHPHVVEARSEIGIDISEQYPKGLGTYLGKRGFNYLVIVCDRAEQECPKIFPGVGTRFSWIFDDPRAEGRLPEDESLERFREIRDQIELKIKEFLDNLQAELQRLKEEREHRELHQVN
jgi:arsenate reductase